MLGGVFSGEVRAALFALASVGLGAWLYLHLPQFDVWNLSLEGRPMAVLAVTGAAALLGLLASRLAKGAFPANPYVALALIETRAFVALAILAGITWATLCASGLLAAGDADPAPVKQYLGALEKAVAAVIAAIGTAVAGSKSGNAVAVLAQAQFEEGYKSYGATPPSADELEVQHAAFSDPYVPERQTNKDGTEAKGAEGWGFEARWRRARAIVANM